MRDTVDGRIRVARSSPQSQSAQRNLVLVFVCTQSRFRRKGSELEFDHAGG